ncbi:Piso0_001747 [Millerozyma farinosa CBS 7064]|uniref:Piso0_001747 protein n=1 Tax=Pichia sorbitophila (strain ATCC MYA-4447 / BCRC 22081 / CBS 7064 / NBRC 10061 / NRRL Y-12695) TaxID=559304 RepID=G8YNZ7_PICSO|nr:Piso0_001747 [Millerozyma farinosa CBS 7064]
MLCRAGVATLMETFYGYTKALYMYQKTLLTSVGDQVLSEGLSSILLGQISGKSNSFRMGQQTSAPKLTAQDRAIFQLKQQRDKLKIYQRKLSGIMERQNKLAMESIKNQELERARFYLRSKKQQQNTINKTYDSLENLEKLISTIEFKLIEKDVMYGLQQGNEVLKRLNKEMSVEKMDKLLDECEEEKIKVEDISDMLGMGSGLSRSEEDEVEEEMLALEHEAGITDNKQAQPKVSFPDAPSKVPETDEREEELEEEAPRLTSNNPLPA